MEGGNSLLLLHMDETIGTLKLFVSIRSEDGRGGARDSLRMIWSAWGLTKKEAEHKLIEFVRVNPRLPIVRAVWQPRKEDLDLNFVNKK
jgi:hypothetical protein